MRPDKEWMSRMRLRDKTLATVLTFPLLLRYNYPVTRARDTT